MEAKNNTAVQNHAQTLLRESGYNASILKGEGRKGEDYSRAMGLWKDSCKLVREVFPEDEANRMIEATWNPNKVEFLQSA